MTVTPDSEDNSMAALDVAVLVRTCRLYLESPVRAIYVSYDGK